MLFELHRNTYTPLDSTSQAADQNNTLPVGSKYKNKNKLNLTNAVLLTPFLRNDNYPTLFLNSNKQPIVSFYLAQQPYSLAIGGPPGDDGNIFLPPVHIQPQNFPVSNGLYDMSIPFYDTPIIISSSSTNLSIFISQ